MPLSEKRKASNRRWDEKNLARMSLAVPVDLHNSMKEHIKKTKETMNGFVKRAIAEAIEREESTSGG